MSGVRDRIDNAVLAFLSRNWAGLAIAVAVAAVGWILFRLGVRYAGIAVIAAGIILAAGALAHLIAAIVFAVRYPPPGKMVDVGGYLMHVWAEGENNGNPTVVWLAGGHGSGLGFYHMHKLFRSRTRSILIDRPTSGWSDTGPYPRSTSREVEEVHRALAGAGEQGPFIFAGHSYGGMLSVLYALRHGADVAGIVLLDATHPNYVIYSIEDLVSPMARRSELIGLAVVFGGNFFASWFPVHPAVRAVTNHMKEKLADVLTQFQTLETQPRARFAFASIFRMDLQLGHFFPTLVFDGELGNMPVAIVLTESPPMEEIERTMPELTERLRQTFYRATGLDRAGYDRYNSIYGKISRQYLGVSTGTKLFLAPKGATHNFPYETPDIVVTAVDDTIARAAAISRTNAAG